MSPSLRLVLVGYRASGKSTLGRAIAQRYRCPFVDADHYLEERAGRSIRDIFSTEGQDAFRDLEGTCLRELLEREAPLVIATGGGIVERAENRARLCAADALVVYLEAPVGLIQSRLRRNAGGRPSLSGTADVAVEVPPILERRHPWYVAVADARIKVGQREPGAYDQLVAVIDEHASA